MKDPEEKAGPDRLSSSPALLLSLSPARLRNRVFGAPHDFQTRHLVPAMERIWGRIPPHILHHQVYYRLSKGMRDRYRQNFERLLFHTVSLETRTLCNGRCEFCPGSQKGTRPDLHMPWETFRRVIDQLAALNYTDSVSFHINNEPLLDKRLPEMIAYARRACPNAKLVISTNGILLNLDRAREIFAAGLSRLIVNVYTADQSWLPGVHEVARELPEEYWRRTYIFLRRVDERISNRAGTSPNMPKLAAPMRAFCELPFNQLNITADGRVGLCCQDFFFSHVLGNVNEQNLLAIWFSPGYRDIRNKLLHFDRSASPLCAVCDYHGFKQLVGPYALFKRLIPWLWW